MRCSFSAIVCTMAGFLLLLDTGRMAVAQETIHIRTDERVLTVPLNPLDVRSLGMGKTGLAGSTGSDGMLFNPAVLGTRRTTVQVFGMSAGLPLSTFNALHFLSATSTINEFKTASFVKKIRDGATNIINEVNNGQNPDPGSIAEINSGLDFAGQLHDNVLGSTTDPKVHGIDVIPAIQGQIGNIGFALYGNMKFGFSSQLTPQLDQIYKLQLPADLATLSHDQLAAEAAALLEVFNSIIDPITNEVNYLAVIPTTFATAYVDIVGAVGYGYAVNPGLNVGATLKVINRRFSTKIIDPDHYDGILKEVQSDFNSSVTSVTIDLGGQYRLTPSNTLLGISIQNIIPMPVLSSSAEFGVYIRDDAGAIHKVLATVPFALKTPLLINLGASQPVIKGLLVSVDWVDVAAQNQEYEAYIERFRIGAEYTLETSPGGFAVAGRLGLADKRFTGGLGISFWKFVRIDGAYAYDQLIGDNSWFASVVFGF
ncbi:MAG: hypothetical protein WB699_01695 [Bacteroidota bacterium]